jgi:hypothetical protein
LIGLFFIDKKLKMKLRIVTEIEMTNAEKWRPGGAEI